MLLRLLFPSWAFFDAVFEIPCLEVRRRASGDENAMWTPALTAPPRRWHALVWNPLGNAHLAMQGIVDRFAVEVEHGVTDAVTRDLVQQLALRAIAERDPGIDPEAWEWRVVAVQGSTLDAAAGRRVLYGPTALVRPA